MANLNKKTRKLEITVKMLDNIKSKENKSKQKQSNRRLKNQRVSDQVRHLIYESYLRGETWDRLQEQFSVSRGTISNIKKEFESDEPPKKRKKTSPKSVFEDFNTQVETLYLVEEHPEWTLK